MQSSKKKKKTQIDRSIRSLSQLSEKKKEKKNISVSIVHTFSPVLSVLSGCQSPASSNSVVTHSQCLTFQSKSTIQFLSVVFVLCI